MSLAVQRCGKILIMDVKLNPMALFENATTSSEACVKLPEKQSEDDSSL